jgi:putative aldouronate transport system substrate-binding protein
MKRCALVIFMFSLVALMVFSGGSQNSGSKSTSTDGGNPVLTLTSMYFTAEVPTHPAIDKRLEDLTGYKVNINWIPSTAYTDKFNTMLASNTLTDIVVVNDLKSSAYINAVDDGLFWTIDPYLKDYPHLVDIGEARYMNTKRNGKTYGIPRGRLLVRSGMNYREDWAEDLGIKGRQPSTLEDIDKMVRGFAARPGAKYGLIMGCAGSNPIVPSGVEWLAIYYGAPLNYGFDKSGKLVHAWLTDEYTRAVEQFRTWYADGLINKNFVEITNEGSYSFINAEEAGFVFITTDDIQSRFSDLYKKNPNARMWYAMQINNHTVGSAGFNAAFGFSTSAVKNENQLRHCLNFINNLAVPEWQTLINLGLEGEMYTMVDGYATQSDIQNERFSATANGYAQINCYTGVYPVPVNMKRIPALEAMEVERLNYVDTCTMDPTTPYVSETFAKIGVSELDPIRVDAINRYIMGLIDNGAYQAAQKRWLDLGGTTVLKEFEDKINTNK